MKKERKKAPLRKVLSPPSRPRKNAVTKTDPVRIRSLRLVRSGLEALFARFQGCEFPTSSDRLEGAPRAEQLQQVVGQTNQLPFGTRLRRAAKAESPESTPLLDLPEDSVALWTLASGPE